MIPTYRPNQRPDHLFRWAVVGLLAFLAVSVALPQTYRTVPRLETTEQFTMPGVKDCSTLPTPHKVRDLCFDLDADSDGDGSRGETLQCKAVSNSRCSSWESLAGTADVTGLSEANYVLLRDGSSYELRNTAGGTTTGTEPGALLQAAVTALASTGGRIAVQAGTYIPTTAVSLSGTTGVSIECAPGATFQKTADNDDIPVFSGTGAVRARISGCTFDNDGQTVALGAGEIDLVGGSDIEIVGNKWLNMDGARPAYAIEATYGTGSSGLRIANNLIRSNSPTAENKSAVSIVGWSDVEAKDNHIEGYGGFSYQVGGTALADTKNVEFVGNTFVNVHATNMLVRPSGSSCYGVDGVRVIGNLSLFDGGTESETLKKGLTGIGEIIGSSCDAYVRNVVVSDNIVVGSLGIAIKIGDASLGGAENVVVANNVIDGRGYISGEIDSTSINYGIALFGPHSRNVRMIGNVVRHVQQYGVLSYVANNVAIENNDFDHTNQASLDGESSNTSPVLIAQGFNVTVRNNKFRRCFTPTHASSYTTSAITVQSPSTAITDWVVVEGNIIIDDRDHDSDGDGTIEDIDGDGTVAASDERGMEYGIRLGTSDAYDDPVHAVLRNNSVYYPITGGYVVRSQNATVKRIVVGNSVNGRVGFEIGSGAESVLSTSCIAYNSGISALYEDKDCNDTLDATEYAIGSSKAKELDSDGDATEKSAQIIIDSSSNLITFRPDGSTTQAWYMQTNLLRHSNGTADPGAYFQSNGFLGIQADSDNDGTGVEYIQFDPNGDDVYDWIINGSGQWVYEGTADGYETTITTTNPTADRTITLPDASGTVATISSAGGVSTLRGLSGDTSLLLATSSASEGVSIDQDGSNGRATVTQLRSSYIRGLSGSNGAGINSNAEWTFSNPAGPGAYGFHVVAGASFQDRISLSTPTLTGSVLEPSFVDGGYITGGHGPDHDVDGTMDTFIVVHEETDSSWDSDPMDYEGFSGLAVVAGNYGGPSNTMVRGMFHIAGFDDLDGDWLADDATELGKRGVVRNSVGPFRQMRSGIDGAMQFDADGIYSGANRHEIQYFATMLDNRPGLCFDLDNDGTIEDGIDEDGTSEDGDLCIYRNADGAVMLTNTAQSNPNAGLALTVTTASGNPVPQLRSYAGEIHIAAGNPNDGNGQGTLVVSADPAGQPFSVYPDHFDYSGQALLGTDAKRWTTIYGSILDLSSIVQLEPTDSPPTCDSGTKGAIYYDTSNDQPCYCNGSSWRKITDGTAC